MIKFIPTLLLIPVCSLPVSMAYSGEPPDGTIRVAAISALAAVAVPKTATHAAATDIQSRHSTVGATAPHAAAPHAATPYQDAAPAKAAAPPPGALDLRAPDLRSVQWQDLLRATPPDSGEAPPVAVVTASPKERSNTYLSLAGIGSIYWAARHPAHAWEVLLPVEPGDDSNAYADVRSQCAFIARAPRPPSGRVACP
jgi:hypothetical protein